MNEFQERVDAIAYITNMSEDMKDNLIELVSAAAELCSEYKKTTERGKISFTINRNFEIALAKAFHSLILVANSAGVDLGHILDEMIEA